MPDSVAPAESRMLDGPAAADDDDDGGGGADRMIWIARGMYDLMGRFGLWMSECRFRCVGVVIKCWIIETNVTKKIIIVLDFENPVPFE